MRGDVTMQHRLSLAGRIQKLIPGINTEGNQLLKTEKDASQMSYGPPIMSILGKIVCVAIGRQW